jgi:serine phosphatase RsbU (regulator of sigma subunit)
VRAEFLATSAITIDRQSPLIKQLPMVGLFSIAVGMTFIVPTVEISSEAALLASILLTAAATALAAVLGVVDRGGRFAIVVPGIDFIIVGVLRYATGESASIFASLAVLPAVWVAAMPGRRHIAYALGGVLVGLVLPFLLLSTLEESPNEFARGLFSALSFGVAAAVINELARLARRNVARVRRRERSTQLELEQASDVQRALLPKTAPSAHGYDFAGVCVPSKAIGGDFFDWYDIPGGTAFTVGDVMGKGVGAGIIAATVRAVIRSGRSSDDLSVAVERTSDCLASDLGETAAFATLFHARLDDVSGFVRYIDAGHGLSLVVRADGSWERLMSHNLPVGISTGEEWITNEVELREGDWLISCSDGILDLYDGDVGSLGHIAAFAAESGDAADVVRHVTDLARSSDANEDDITVLVVRRIPD